MAVELLSSGTNEQLIINSIVTKVIEEVPDKFVLVQVPQPWCRTTLMDGLAKGFTDAGIRVVVMPADIKAEQVDKEELIAKLNDLLDWVKRV